MYKVYISNLFRHLYTPYIKIQILHTVRCCADVLILAIPRGLTCFPGPTPDRPSLHLLIFSFLPLSFALSLDFIQLLLHLEKKGDGRTV